MRVSESTYKQLPPELQRLFSKLPNPGSDEVVRLFPVTVSKWSKQKQPPNPDDSMFGMAGTTMNNFVGDNGSAARYFYCAKASTRERNMGLEEGRRNIHTTVKPLALLEYLCNLTKTPSGGVVLDPFTGSGTVGVVCQQLGREFVGLDLSIEYLQLARERTGAKALDEWENGVTDNSDLSGLPLFGEAI